MAKRATARTTDKSKAEDKSSDLKSACQEYSLRINEAMQQMQERTQKAYRDHSQAVHALALSGAHCEAVERSHQAHRAYYAAVQAAAAAGWTTEARQKVEEEYKRYLDAYNEALAANDAVSKEHQQLVNSLAEELQAISAEAREIYTSAYRNFLEAQQEAWSGIDVKAVYPQQMFAMGRDLASVAAHAACTVSRAAAPGEE
jgi:hypothetical protein